MMINDESRRISYRCSIDSSHDEMNTDSVVVGRVSVFSAVTDSVRSEVKIFTFILLYFHFVCEFSSVSSFSGQSLQAEFM